MLEALSFGLRQPDPAAGQERRIAGCALIGTVSTALLEMQGALVARSLYPAGHPRILACEQRAAELLHECLAEEQELTLFALDDRVIFNGEILPASSSLIDTMFPMLHSRGVDQLTFKHGLAREEIASFLDQLAANEGKARQFVPSTHIGIGFLKQEARTGNGDNGGRPGDRILAFAADAADVLPNVWQGIGDEKNLDTGALGDIVSCLSKVVNDSSGAMLPLAPLKQHDEYTFVHTINVAILSTALGEALGFDAHTCHELSIAALLHDVGKQAIPQEILEKQGRFTEEEFRVMQMHTVEGARILINTPGIPELAPIVAYEHHARINGAGYPPMPKGWRLSLASRIVQMADVFDALRTTRPYRVGMPIPRVVEVMRHDVGVFFDGDLLRIFFERVISRGIPEPAAAT
jgi:putative nucleotidyltransferase with HDIG domain